MSKKPLVMLVCLLSLILSAGLAGAQMSGGRGMMMQPGQMQQAAPLPAPAAPGASYAPGMMGMGGAGGMMGGGMMGMGGAGGMMGGGMMGMGGAGGMMGGGMMGMMMSHMMGGGMMGMGGAGGMMNLARLLPSLDLSPSQWDKVRALAYSRLEKMAALRAKLFQNQLEMANLSARASIDPAKVKKVFAQQAQLKADMFLVSWDYLQQLKKVLTPEQLKKLQGPGRH